MRDEILALLNETSDEPRNTPKSLTMTKTQADRWERACELLKVKTNKKKSPLPRVAVKLLMQLADEVLSMKSEDGAA